MNKKLVLLAVMLIFSISSFAQQQISGKIKDEKGKDLPFVNISIKGKAGGVVSNRVGNYSIKVTKKDVIIFSFIGFKTKEVTIKDQKVLNVFLKSDNVQLSEVNVVHTGYQKIEKERMTGSVSVMGTSKIKETGASTIGEALRGQMSGVTVSSVTGALGEPAKIRIRGLNGLSGNMDPVWIVDGIQISNGIPTVGNIQNALLTDGIGDISPNDIESVTILKDAAASAIYGSQAANGVIVITTKKGAVGQTKVNISVKHYISQAPKNKLDLMNTREKLTYEDELFEDFADKGGLNTPYINMLKRHQHGLITSQELNDYRSDLEKNNDDPFKHVFRQAKSTDYQISLSGGSNKTTFYGSLNYAKDQGTLIESSQNKIAARFSLTHKFTDKFSSEISLNTSRRENITPRPSIDAFSYLVQMNPYETMYNEDGSYHYDNFYNIYSTGGHQDAHERDLVRGFNTVEDIKSNQRTSLSASTSLRAKLTYNPIKDLSIIVLGGYNYSSRENSDQVGSKSIKAMTRTWISRGQSYHWMERPLDLSFGSKKQALTTTDAYTLRSSVSYKKEYNKHKINIFGGQEISESNRSSFMNFMPIYNEAYEMGAYPNFFKTDLINDFSLDQLGSTAITSNKKSAFFTKIDYTFNGKYVLSYNARWDGASIIGGKNQFTPLKTYSARWNTKKEGFMQNIKFIDDLAIRASYGETGMIDRSALPHTVLKFGGSYYYNESLLPSDVRYANPNIKWQKKEDKTLGLDVTLLKRRVTVVFDYYDNLIKDLLDSKYYPISSGTRYLRANVASVKNKGFEISTRIRLLQKQNWEVSTDFNLSKYKNKIVESEIDDVSQIAEQTRYARKDYIKGDPTSAIYGYKFAGIDPANGHTLLYARKGANIHEYMVHSERDGRKIVDADNFKGYHEVCVDQIGNREPTLSGGFGLRVRYKRLVLTSSFSYMAGNDITTMEGSMTPSGLFDANRNTVKGSSRRWRRPGDITDVGPLAFSSTEGSSAAYPEYAKNMYDKYLTSGDFIKCTSIALAYRVPTSLLNKLKLSSATINLGVQNAFTLTKFNGLDPEARGFYNYPNPRKFNLSVNLTL